MGMLKPGAGLFPVNLSKLHPLPNTNGANFVYCRGGFVSATRQKTSKKQISKEPVAVCGRVFLRNRLFGDP